MMGLLPLQRRDFALEGLWGPPPTEGSPTVRQSVITGPVALSLINNGTIVTHQVDPPDRVDQSNVRNWSRSITPVSRRPDTGVIGCGSGSPIPSEALHL